jgi:hypothetical protein
MKTYMSYLVGFALILSMLACAKPPIKVERVIVKNATKNKVTDVQVRHEPTKKFGAVNGILPNETLDIGLSATGAPLLARQALILWRDGGGLEWSVTLEIPSDRSVASAKQSVTLVYTIFPSGRATVHLQ